MVHRRRVMVNTRTTGAELLHAGSEPPAGGLVSIDEHCAVADLRGGVLSFNLAPDIRAEATTDPIGYLEPPSFRLVPRGIGYREVPVSTVIATAEPGSRELSLTERLAAAAIQENPRERVELALTRKTDDDRSATITVVYGDHGYVDLFVARRFSAEEFRRVAEGGGDALFETFPVPLVRGETNRKHAAALNSSELRSLAARALGKDSDLTDICCRSILDGVGLLLAPDWDRDEDHQLFAFVSGAPAEGVMKTVRMGYCASHQPLKLGDHELELVQFPSR
jgi:hypothetical protein